MATQADVGRYLDLSTRRVRDLANAGAIPRPKVRGNWDLDDCRIAYIRHLRSVAGGLQDDKGKYNLAAERARLAAEQADAAAMKNDQARRELVPVADVVKVVSDEYSAVRARILALPTKVAPRVAAVTKPAEVRQIIDAAVREVLDELSYSDGPGAPSGSGRGPKKRKANKSKATAKTNSQRVGGRKQKAKSGGKRRARTVANK